MAGAKLYTPAMLAAAVELANYPPLESAPLHGRARSKTCGSDLALDVIVDQSGNVMRIGLTVRACAVGQAAAAVFARHVSGRNLPQIEAAYDRLAAWLEDEAPAPEWPDLELIAPARDYRARHGAMLLPWKAAMLALSSITAAS